MKIRLAFLKLLRLEGRTHRHGEVMFVNSRPVNAMLCQRASGDLLTGNVLTL